MPDLENEKSVTEIKNQQGQWLKILTPNQMHCRLTISSAQLKTGNNSEKLKKEIRQNCIHCTDQKNLQKMSIIIWSTLFKNGSNLYEHWKQ